MFPCALKNVRTIHGARKIYLFYQEFREVVRTLPQMENFRVSCVTCSTVKKPDTVVAVIVTRCMRTIKLYYPSLPTYPMKKLKNTPLLLSITTTQRNQILRLLRPNIAKCIFKELKSTD